MTVTTQSTFPAGKNNVVTLKRREENSTTQPKRLS